MRVRATKVCKYCGKEFEKLLSDSVKYFERRLYCSQKCMALAYRKPPKEKTQEQIARVNERLFHEGYGATRKFTHPIYNTWKNMRRRCGVTAYRPPFYKNYGGRGITVCDEWKNNYNAFLEWALENNWQPKSTIERIDNNGNYEPSNCRWATRHEQLRNRRNNILVTYKGKTQTAQDWATDIGLSAPAFKKRLIVWNDVVRAIEEPIHINQVRYKKG